MSAGIGLRAPSARAGNTLGLAALLSLLLVGAVAGIVFVPGSASPPVAPAAVAQGAADSRLAGLPLNFVENRGQADPRVRYYVEGKGSSVYFTAGGLTMSLPGQEGNERWNLKLEFLGAGGRATPVARGKTPAEIGYFKGERADWKAGLSTYSEVAYPDVWPGIDLVYSGTGSKLKYAFRVAPGADPSDIRMGWSGASGVRLDDRGQLAVSTPAGGFVDEKPRSYQVVDGRRQPVASAYAVGAGHDYGFELGAYDRSKALVIDPAMLVYAGFIGGSGNDAANSVVVGGGDNLYVTGSAGSSEATFPEKVGPDLTFAGGTNDAFVAKLNSSGSELLYAGYIGGSDDEIGVGIAVDGAGAAYVTGTTSSSEAEGFPVVVGPDTTYNGSVQDAFVAKVKPDGSGLDWAGYIGGSLPPTIPAIPNEQGNGISVDSSGAVYVAGFTPATGTGGGFPDGDGFGAVPGFDQTPNGIIDTFVAKVKANGTGLDYATYIGGSGLDPGTGLVIDGAGNAYINGFTGSSEASFPDGDGFGAIPGFDRTFNGEAAIPFPDDVYVAKLNPTGTSLVYATYIGGSGVEQPFENALDAAGNLYLTGYTTSTQTSFPDGDGFGAVPGFDRTHNGGTGGGAIVGEGLETDVFVAKLNPAGTGLAYASYLGGARDEMAVGIDVDGGGRAHVVGTTESTEATAFPARNGPDGTYNGGETDAFVAGLSAAGTALDYAGYVGGANNDIGIGVAVNAAGDAYVSGSTTSTQTTFPAKVGPDLTQNGPAGTEDAFVAKLRVTPPTVPPPPPPPPPVYPTPPFPGCAAPTANVINGTAASNTITGTARADRIFARAGNDIVAALAGNDCVDLGTGADRGQGGAASDLLLGGAGGDRVRGGSGRDRMRGGAGNDRLAAGSGNDRVSGDSGKDRIGGNSGNDSVSGGSGNDSVSGSSGNDRIEGSSGNDRLTGGRGGDRLSGGSGSDRIDARDGRRDRIACGRGRDRVIADRVDRVARDCERVRRSGRRGR